jgi:hypothetical protein
MSDERNRYAEQVLEDTKKNYDDEWTDTTADEMEAYPPLCTIIIKVKEEGKLN